MLVHIVMWKLKDLPEVGTKQELCKKIKTDLEGLAGKIEGLESIHVGIDTGVIDTNYDVVLYTEFKGQKELEYYASHPEHLNVATFIRSVYEDRKAVDYMRD